MQTRSWPPLLLGAALGLFGAVACGRLDAPVRSLPEVGRMIDAALAALPAPSTVTVTGPADETATVGAAWIVAHPYRSEEQYAGLGVSIDEASVAHLVGLGNSNPECILVARIEGARIVEVGHLRCDRTIRIEVEKGMLALRVGDRIAIGIDDGGTITIRRVGIGDAPQ
jgi:hypothetical protein